MKFSLDSTPTNLRVFTACLLSFTILITPIAAVAAPSLERASTVTNSEGKKSDKATLLAKELFVNPPALKPAPALPGPQPEPAPQPLPVGSVTAVMTGAIVATANNGDGKADPGDTINYTVTLGNTTGTDANGLSFNDLLDSHTTFVPGSIKSSPVCFDQSVSTNEDVDKAITLTGQDPDGDSLTFTIVTPPTNGGFGATTAPNLTYTPNANFFGSDSFTFRVNDGTTSGTGANGNSNETCTVSITINSVNDAPTFTVPGNPAAVNEDAGAQNVLFITPASIRPAQSGNTTEDAQTVSFVITNNTNPGLFSTPPAINVNAGAYPRTANLTYTPAANQNGTATITYHAHDDGGTANSGVDNSADQTFTITVNAVNDPPVVVAPAAFSVQANMKRTGLTGLLGNVNDNADNGVNGCVSTTFTVTSFPATSANGGTISNTNTATGTFDYDPPAGFTGTDTFTYTVSDTGCPGVAVSTPPTTVTINVSNPVIWFVNLGAGVNGDGRLSSPFNSLASANTKLGSLIANQRIFLYTTGATPASAAIGDVVTLQGSGTQAAAHWLIGQGAIAADFDTLMGISPPANTIARPSINGVRPIVRGTVTMKDNTVVRGLNIDVSAGATKGLTGSSLGAGSVLAISDVNVTSAGGNAVDFSSAQTISYTTGNASTSPNILSSTSATALSVVNTTIGASGLTFRSISAGNNTAAADPASGIVLNNTGSSGGLTVTGNSSGLCGGQVVVNAVGTPATVTAPSTGDCTGGTIQNTTGDAIVATSTKDLSLTRMFIQNAVGHGINASNLGGTSLLANSTIQDYDKNRTATKDGVIVVNNNTSMTKLTISNSTFDGTTSDAVNPGSGDGVFMEAQGSSNMALTVNGCAFTEMFDDGVQANGITGSTGTFNVTVKNSAFKNAAVLGNGGVGLFPFGDVNMFANIESNTFDNIMLPTANLGAISMTNGKTANFDCTIQHNTINNLIGSRGITFTGDGTCVNKFKIDDNTIDRLGSTSKHGISLNLTQSADGSTATADAIISNNRVGTLANLWTSGDGTGNPVLLTTQNSTTMNAVMTGNTVSANTSSVIEVMRTRAISSSTLNATVSSNTLTDTSGTHVEFDASTGSGAVVGGTICLDISSNILPGGGVGVIKVTENAAPGAINVKQTQAVVSSGNSSATVTVTGTPQFGTNTSCAQPTTPTLPSIVMGPVAPARGLQLAAFNRGYESPDLLAMLMSNGNGGTSEGEGRMGNSPEPTLFANAAIRVEQNDSNDSTTSLFGRAASSLSQLANSIDLLIVPTAYAEAGAGVRSQESGVRAHHARSNSKLKTENLKLTTAAPIPVSGGTFPINGTGSGFTLPPNKTITITFSVTLNNPPNLSGVPPAAPQVFNHGQLSGGFGASPLDTNTITKDVDLFDSTTTLISSANPSNSGQAVTFTATIGTSGTPDGSATNRTGTVLFKDGGSAIVCSGGNQTVSANQATCITSALSNGSHMITAEYSGDGNFDPSTSNTVTQTVNACSATVVVTSAGDSGAGTLRQAIADMCDGGTITFDTAGVFASPQTITLTTGELSIAKNLTIDGPDAAGNHVTVSGNNASRIFNINSGKTATVRDLTVTGGLASGGFPANAGGGIYSDHGTLTLINMTISGNTADDGGGVYSDGTTSGSATLTITDSTISGNTAISGGGVYNAGPNSGSATLTIAGSTISGNTASGDGGGVYNNGTLGGSATLTLTNSTISGNGANNDGGGIYNHSATSTSTLTSVTVTKNTADKDDAGGGAGGGLNVVSGTFTLKNTIVAGNFKGTAAPVADDIVGTADAASSFNLIGTGGSGGLVDATNNNQVGVADAKLGALANNGGPTQTHALLDLSPALEKGNAFALTTDQRGFPRPVDFDTTAPVAPYDDTDIGAFERQIPPAAPATPDLQPGSDSFGAGTGGTNSDDITKTTPRVFDIGSVTTGATVELLRDTNPLGGTEVVVASGVASSSTIALSDPNVLADGDYYYRARQTLGSDTSPLSPLPGLKVTIDTTAPAAPSTPDLQAGSDTGNTTDDKTSAVSRAFDITNTETGNLVELLRNGTPVASTLAPGASVVLTDSSSPGDGTYNYSARQTDVAGNSTTSAAALSVTIDMTPPTVSSSVRVDPNPTAAATVQFTVTFSEAVTGVDIMDFSITTTGGISGTSVTNVTPVDASHYTVTVDTGTGDGTLRLDVVDDDTILDIVGLPLGGTGAGNGNFTAGQVYLISKSDPFVSSITRTDLNPTNAASVNFTVIFSKSVTGVNIGANSDFVLTTSGVAGTSITGLSGSGTTYTVTVNTGTGNGTIRLDVTDDDTIVDSGSRPLGGAGVGNGDFTTGEVYNIDKTPPDVTINQAAGQLDPVTAPTAGTVIHFTAVFTKSVADFTNGDVSITGGANASVVNVIQIAPNDGTTYDVAVEGMTQSGTVIASIASGVAHDSAGNGNTTGTFTDHTVTYFVDNFSTFEVNTTADTDDGSCNPLGTGPGNQDCTLREAINAANADAGAETITFNSTVFAAPGPYTINLTGALPDLSTDMTIAGPGANVLTVKRNTGGNYRIFNIPSGNVTIDKLAISNGNVTGDGGGILDDSAGTVSVTNSTINGNSASTGAGGGITHFGVGTLNITDSTISGNSASSTGGGIHLGTFATVNITNSTISGNTANGDGGGIYTANVPLTITNSTITNNRADNDNNASGTGGGIFRSSGTVTLRNTIVARNFNDASPSTTADDIAGTVDAASSFNLIGTGGAGGLVNGTNSNQVGVVDPGLNPLADNGGPTMTHALLCASPAIDKGKSFGSTSDQRGLIRPFDLSDSVYPDAVGGDASDIGAFEIQAAGGCIPVAVPPAPPPSTDQDTPVVITLTGTYSQNTALSFTITQQPGHSTGALVPSAPNCVFTSSMTCTSTVTYTPSLNYVGPDFFKFKVSAGALDSEEAQVDITVNSTVDLTVTKTHVGNFTQADTGKTYTIKVSNVGLHASSGTVTLTDNLPAGLTATSWGGTGWNNCTATPVTGPAMLTCDRSTVLPGGGAGYPVITLTVDVSCTAPPNVTNTATVSGGGDATPGNNTANDATIITPDNTPPMIICPGGITKFADAGQNGATVNPGVPAATDNCGAVTITAVRSDGKPLNELYPIGVTLITWTAKDAANNTASCAQSIMIMVPSGERPRPRIPPDDEEALLVGIDFLVAFLSAAW